MKSILSPSQIFGSGILSWTLTALALTFGLVVTASATDPLYQNFSVRNYDIPTNPPPTIDAFNFDNENQFNVSFDESSLSPQFYEPMNTVNYTNRSSGVNTGIMSVNGLNFGGTGVGFQFDTQTTNTVPHQMAGTFYNAGTILCNSTVNGNNLIFFGNENFFQLFDIGQCLVWATNIISPGTIDASEGGQIQLTGQNVDLSRTDLILEQGLFSSNNVDVSINSEGAGFDTNQDWNPAADLTTNFAFSSFPDNLVLVSPTSYFAQKSLDSSNMLVRAVFIVNANSNVAANVYIAPTAFDSEGALIQWSGTFLDSATGQTDTNYLYLYHYYPGSFGLTNIFPILSVGTPAVPGAIGFFNYLWAQSTPNPALGTPTSPGFQEFAPDNVITNVYEFFNASLAGTTVNTNANTTNPSGALTNLQGRIQITASRDLELKLAQISGANYMSIMATNQFDGSAGASISTPYADLNLGVTNGTLTVSNLLVANIPQWGGTVNEWSTRWTNTDASGVNWDYRVMLVYANLTPSISPQVQNLALSGTNLVISDVLNVFGSMYANARSLTLTTNYFGGGASSPDGELDMQLEDPDSWSWPASFPNLLFLTNSGAINMPNFSDFASTSSLTNIIATTPAVQAAATLALFPSTNTANVAGGNVTILGTPYVFTNKLNNTVPFQVIIGKSFNGSMSNLIAAINQGPGSGVNYSSDTFASSVAVAGLLNVANHSVVISANPNYSGHLGNGIPVSTTVTNLAWNSSVLTGGVDLIPGSTNITSMPSQYGAIINYGFISDQGSTISVTNFLNGGEFLNGSGSFLLTSLTTTLTNGSITAGGDISLTANTIVASNVMLQAGRSLVLQATNLLSDTSVSNGNVWVVGSTNGTGGDGLILPFLPIAGNAPQLNNLLGTTISLVTPPPNKEVSSTWAGLDYGDSTLGYNTNNVAIGQLVLTSEAQDSDFYFTGPPGSTTSNAIYVDRLILENYASLADREGSAGIPTLQFNNNPNAGSLTIYYADAMSSSSVNGGPLQDVSSVLNGLNNGHLVWVPQYIGYFSGTNVMYPGGGIVRLNLGVYTGGGNGQMSSNGSGIPNSNQQTPVFVASQIDFKEFHVANSNELTWHSPPGATNFVLCTTNWANWNTVTVVTNPPIVPPPTGWPITNVIYEPTNAHSGGYRIMINQNNSILYGQ